MTREERAYWYKQLKKMFEEWVATTTPENISSDLAHFEDKYMQTITGQQPLPQEVFRIFLRECLPVYTGNFDAKQDRYDEGLLTDDKTVRGAINEVLEKATNVDDTLSITSTNAVQNQAVAREFRTTAQYISDILRELDTKINDNEISNKQNIAGVKQDINDQSYALEQLTIQVEELKEENNTLQGENEELRKRLIEVEELLPAAL